MAAKKSTKQPTQAAPRVPTELPLSPRELDPRTYDLGRAGWELVACEDGRGVVTSLIDGASASVDLRAWPPTISPLADGWTRSASRTRDGTWAYLVGWTQQSVLVSRAGRSGAADHEHHAPELTNVVAVAKSGDDVVVTTVGPLAHHRYQPHTGAVHRLDTSAIEDVDTRVFASPVGLVASAKQRSRLVRLP